MVGVLTKQYKEPMVVLNKLNTVLDKQIDSIMAGFDKMASAFKGEGPLADAMKRMFPEDSPLRAAAKFDPGEGLIPAPPSDPTRDPETKQGQWLKDKLENVVNEAAAQEVVKQVESQQKTLDVSKTLQEVLTNPVSGAIGQGARVVVDAWINGSDIEESQRIRKNNKSPGIGNDPL